MARMKKKDLIEALTKQEVTFDPEANYNDLYTLLLSQAQPGVTDEKAEAEKKAADAEVAKADREKLLAQSAEKQAEARAKARADMTPQQALSQDWPRKHKVLAPYITENGLVRGGLKPTDQKIAKEILKRYGF